MTIKRLLVLAVIVGLCVACQSAESTTPAATLTQATSLAATPAAQPTEAPVPAQTAPAAAIPVPEEAEQPADGLIAFYSDRDGNPELYVMNPDGSDPRRLTNSPGEDSSPTWSPDGGRIAFVSDRDDPETGACFPDCHYQIYLIDADGGNEHRLVETELSTLHPDWHPDGTRLTFDTEFDLQGDIYVVNADGSGLERLIEDGFWADWSPDGSQLVFASQRDGNVELYLADADGTNQRRLTDNSTLDYFPAWSPDGERIAFARVEQKRIFVINVDGSNERQLGDRSRSENPAWSPDGSQLLFQSSSEGNFEIYAIDVEAALQGGQGAGSRRLTDNQAADLWPCWGPAARAGTPAGDRRPGAIILASDQDGDWDIYALDPAGGPLQPLTDNKADDLSPAWSPDGAQIAFVSNRDGNDEIYLMKADGSEPRRLTESEASESFPAWSPDGSEISFDSDRDGNWEIYVMSSDGSNVRRLTENPADDWISSWSPDGSQIVFESKRDGDYEIYLMEADGSGQRRLTDDPAHDGFPVWSPDGTQIAFVSRRDGNYEVYVMNADGASQRRVTVDHAEDSDPTWSPDGQWLAFVSQRDGNDEIYVARPDGTGLRRLTANGSREWGPAWQPVAGTVPGAGTWIRSFEGADYGAFLGVALTPEGDILAVGATNHLHLPPYSGDVLLTKLTLAGEVVWERTWGGEGYDQADSVQPAGDGGAYVFGETDSYGAGDRDFFLLKIAQDGTEEWFETYGESRREWPYGMLPLSNGELLLYGFTESTAGGRDQYALCVARDGGVIWAYTVEGPGEELVSDAVETAEGDLVLAVIAGEDGELVKLDADGGVRWARRYELSGWQYASQVAPTDDGGFLLAGFSMSSGARRQADTWLARATSTGELVWETSFGEPGFDDYTHSMIRLADGSYLVGGIANGMLISRVDQDGNVLWRRSLVGERVYGAMELAELEEGGFLVAGLIQLVGGRSYDAILLRTDAEGWIGE